MADCRLTTAEHIEVALDGATITVTLLGVQLQADEVARLTVVQEGPETRCRLEACMVVDSPGTETHDHEESIALAEQPHTVVIEHAGGEETFEFDVLAMPADPGPTRGGGGGIEWRDIATESEAHDVEDVRGPVILPRAPSPTEVVRGDYVGGNVGGNYMDRDDAGGAIQPDAAGPPSIGYAEPSAAPRERGGWLKSWGDRWFNRGARESAPQPNRAEPQPSPGPAPLPTFEPAPTAAMEDDSAAMEPDMAPPAAEMAPDAEPPTAAMANGDGPTAAMANGDGDGDQAEPPAPKGLFPRLDAPEFFPVGVEKKISVGIRRDEDASLGTGAMPLPPGTDETLFILSIEVIADAFDLAGDTTTLLHDLAVTKNQPFPFVDLMLKAKPIDGPDPAKPATIDVIYTVADQVIGKVKRSVAIAVLRAEAEKVELPDVSTRAAMSPPLGKAAADLTVIILMDDAGPDGRLKWTFKTPHPVEIAERTRTTDIGKRPEAFARALRSEAEKAEGKSTLLKTMRGIGREVADVVHEDFWPIYDGVRKIKPNPTVLILSEEPHVPWELAILPKAIEPDRDIFLSAEAVTGRWLLDGPHQPPPEQLLMKSMAVVFGEYKDSKFKELKEAKAEMESLTSTFEASPVRATDAALNLLLDGNPNAEVMHFAIHGKFTDEGADLLLEDGSALGPFTIRGANLTNGPFVFLNACQVGAANELLGEFAGMAEAFINAGACAVVAPLWSVRDDIAREISLRFYPAAFGGDAPAEVLRRERASFTASDPPLSSTFLAYQFYGHPSFRLSK